MTESVWDYPRPPRLEPSTRRVVVRHCGAVIADSIRTMRILETSHPPVYYIPRDDISPGVLLLSKRQTFCPYKGVASYRHVHVGDQVSTDAAWSYDRPAPAYEALTAAVAFHPGILDECTVDGERVTAQAGDFYGGWITGDIVGQIEGGPVQRARAMVAPGFGRLLALLHRARRP